MYIVLFRGTNEKEVYVFYGIPFAKPPVGDLRFRRPEPYTKRWERPFDATKVPNTCPQVINFNSPSIKISYYSV